MAGEKNIVVSAADRARFCRGCENIGSGYVCNVGTQVEQSRWINVGSCGRAVVGGEKGWLFTNGFESFRSIDGRNKTEPFPISDF